MRRPWLALLLLATACGSADTQENPPCGPNGECPAGFECRAMDRRCYMISITIVDAAIVVVPDAPLPSCPAKDGLPGASGPTMHGGGDMTVNETWTAAGSPHIVSGQVRVGGTAILTIEPCADVQLTSNGYITVGLARTAASLVAEGTAASPILFRARDVGAAWNYLLVQAPATMRLVHVDLEGGGADRFRGYATLVAFGDGAQPFDPILHVDHVTVKASQGLGVLVDSLGGFDETSTDLAISASGVLAEALGYPLQIGIQEAGSIPPGIYAGNRQQAFFLEHDAEVLRDMTLPDRGVAYETGLSADLRVREATMTLAAGVELRLSKGRNVFVGLSPSTGGALVAAGTTEKPVRIVAMSAADPWQNITAQYPGTVSLTHTVLEGGGDDRFKSDASLVAWGDGAKPLKRNLKVDHVTIRKSKGAGVVVDRMAGFVDGSTDLTVTESGGAVMADPVRITTPAVGTLPPGSYTGNLKDEIFVDTNFNIEGEDVFHAYGVPYHIELDLRVQAASGGPTARLTIEAGNTLRFKQNGAVVVGAGLQAGEIIAIGTAEKPIVFTADSAAPTPGFWRGLNFFQFPANGNSIQFARIEYAGADCSCSGFSCSASGDAGVGFYNVRPETAFIGNTTFAHILGHGVMSGWKSDLDGPDFKAGNVFMDVSGCQQARWKPATTACPMECY